MSLFRTKPLNSDPHAHTGLHRCLTAFDLTLLGIGAIIGAGIFVLTGIAAAIKAGPAISLSYIVAGFAAMFAALSYAELSASIGGSGSAYNYAYTSFGEIIAWIIGWALILEYAMGVATVAVGWAGYVNNLLQALHIPFPENLTKDPLSGGIVNLPAVVIILALASLLCIGTKQSAIFNTMIVMIKLLTICIFIAVATLHVDRHNWDLFLPYGISGIAQGAAFIFFAYIGFDALSTAAEETINPQRDLPIGIILSLSICTLIYIIVSLLLTGIAHYTTLNVASPVADAMLRIGYPTVAGIISVGAIAGLTTVMLVLYYGLTRILFAISRDGLLPRYFSHLHSKSKTPVKIILMTGFITASVAGLVPITDLAELVNIGTLTAFTFVCGGLIVLRWKHPELPRPFKLPWNPLIPALGMIFCIYLIVNLSVITWQRFFIWMVIGLVIYFAYSRKQSLLH